MKNIFLTSLLMVSTASAQMPPGPGGPGGPRRHFDMGRLPDGIENARDGGNWTPDRDHGRFSNDRYCDKYNGSQNPPEYRRACAEGMAAVEDFARDFAYSKGRLDGYLYGFASGLRDGADAMSNDEGSFANGQANYSAFNSQFNAGLSSVSSRGSSDGDAMGSQEAKVRFRNAVNTGSEPAAALNQPSSGYSGQTNAYTSYVGQVPTTDDIVRSDRYRNIPVGVYGRFDRGDRGYDHRDWAMDGRNRLSVVDLWGQMGHYGFDVSSVSDSGRAWRMFTNTNAGRIGMQHWQQVNVVVWKAAPPPAPAPAPAPAPDQPAPPPAQPAPAPAPAPDQPAPAPQDDGQGRGGRPDRGDGQGGPRGDGQGGPRGPRGDGQGPGRQPQQAGPGMIQTTESQDLTSYYQDGFSQAYRQAANHMYAGGFRDASDDGYGDGYDIGSKVGFDEAYYRGQENAFNTNFQATSASTYNSSYAKAYASAFNNTFNFYKTHPVLSVKIKSIKDAANPAIGIIQPGADVSISFEVVNEGGAPAAFSVSSQGDLTATNSGQQFSIPRLKSAVLVAPKIAKMNASLSSHSNATVNLVVNQAGQNIVASNNIQVLKQIELINARPSFSYIQGSGQVTVTVHNNSAIRSPSAVNATLSLNDKVYQNAIVGIVEANADAVAVLKYAGLDPMDIIAGKYKVSYQVMIDKTVLGQASDSITPPDNFDAQLSYYDALYNNQAFIPSTVDRKTRLSSMRQSFITADQAEVNAHMKEKNYWDNSSETVIGKIVAHSRQAQTGTPLRADYDNLGATLFTFVDTMPKDKFLFIKSPSHQRKAYESLVNTLSLKGKYK